MIAQRLRDRIGRIGATGSIGRSSALAVVAAAAMSASLGAQRPERPQEVRVPGIGVLLKAGWQLLFHDGCRFAVPGSWRPDEDGSFVSAPDGSTLSVRALKITNWSAYKSQLRAAVGPPSVLHEDSDWRFWFEIVDRRRTWHYIDVTNGVSACMGRLDIRTSTPGDADDTTRIAESIGPAPERWP